MPQADFVSGCFERGANFLSQNVLLKRLLSLKILNSGSHIGDEAHSFRKVPVV